MEAAELSIECEITQGDPLICDDFTTIGAVGDINPLLIHINTLLNETIHEVKLKKATEELI